MNRFILSVGVIAIFMITSCSSDDNLVEELKKEDVPATTVRKQITLSRAEEQIVGDINEFTFKLFAEEANVTAAMSQSILSPVSAYTYLSMMANGAVGTTLSEYLSMLNVGQDGLDALNIFNNRLATELVALDENVKMHIANSIWETPEVIFKDGFVHAITSQYGAVKYFNDFSVSQTPFNDWLKLNTDGMITSYLDYRSVPKYLVANVCCFKGKWATPFEVKNTKIMSFKNAHGEFKNCDMMNGNIKGCYALTSDSISAYRFYYGSGAWRFTIIMPEDEDLDINTLIPHLTVGKWNEINNEMGSAKIKASMPKFNIDRYSYLSVPLKNMGFNMAFGTNADYSGMCDEKVLADLTQRVRIEVDEDGTKGAVISSSDELLADNPLPVTMNANRPFIFIVDEASTKAILFIGVVRDIN